MTNPNPHDAFTRELRMIDALQSSYDRNRREREIELLNNAGVKKEEIERIVRHG